MNTSRDIEKLFEHFGGNAGDYQEVGRENEARSARTRWPLLATLDFTQPAIPAVVQRRVVQLPHARPDPSDSGAGHTFAPTPINRGKPPLFARAHRRTIPPVGKATVPTASRFAEFAASEDATQVQPGAPEPATAVYTPAQALNQPPLRAATSGASLQATFRPATPTEPATPAPAQASLRVALPRVSAAPMNTAPVTQPRPSAPPAREAASAPASILGKLFASPAPHPAYVTVPAPEAPCALLASVFDRLRTTPQTAATATPAGNRAAAASGAPPAGRAWAASRVSRS
jgi:hypothetical protein